MNELSQKAKKRLKELNDKIEADIQHQQQQQEQTSWKKDENCEHTKNS
jgi:hypothetical protein